MKILMISDISPESPMFSSQVLPLANELRKHVDVDFFAFDRSGDLKKSIPSLRVLKRCRGPYARISAFRTFLRYRDLLDLNHYQAILCRGLFAVNFVSNFSQSGALPLIFDLRGDFPAELKNKGGLAWPFKVWLCRRAERAALSHASHIFCVSKAMQADYELRYPFLQGKPMSVFAPYVDLNLFKKSVEQRTRVRAKLGIEKKFVYIYSGNLSPYQHVPAMVSRFADVCRNDPDQKFHFIFLTRQDDELKRVLRSFPDAAAHSTVLSVLHSEVPSYLNAADAGVIIRSCDQLNRVASPVKVAEYQALDLPVISKLDDLGQTPRPSQDGLDSLLSSPNSLTKKVKAVIDIVKAPKHPAATEVS